MQSSSNNYISHIIRRGDLRYLSKYIPETLFIETDLPSVIVCNDPSFPSFSNRRNWNICVGRNCSNKEVVDAPLALSVYLPGRPLYRISNMGTLIPVRSPNDEIGNVFALLNYKRCINGYENYDLRAIQVSLDKTNIPEELLAFIELYLTSRSNTSNISRFLKKYRIRRIYTYPFEITSQNCGKVLHWIGLYNGGIESLIFDNYQIDNQIDRGRLIRFIKRESISYPRLFNKVGRSEEYSQINVKLYDEIIDRLIRDSEIGEEIVEIRHNADIYRFAYAIDQYIKQLTIKPKREENITSILKDVLRKCKGLPLKNFPSTGVSVWTQTSYREKVLGIKEGYRHYYVAVIGYKTERTKYLVLKLKKFFSDFFSELESFERTFEKTKKDYIEITSLNPNMSIDKAIGIFYKYWTINSVLFNIIKFYMAHDLVVNTIAQCPQLRTIIDLALAYNDLYSNTKITDMIREMDIDEILDIIISYNDGIGKSSSSFDLTKYVFGLVYSGERFRRCNIGSTRDKLEERFDQLIDHVNQITRHLRVNRPYYGFLAYVLLHTLNHHLMKKISQRSSIPTNYLSEILHDIHTNKIEALVFENISGGIKAIETYVEKILQDKSLLIDDILSMGTCLIGDAEDILYFGSMTATSITRIFNSDQTTVKKTAEEIADKLGIILVNDVVEEINKIIMSVRDNANALAKLIDAKGEEILDEVLKARRDLEIQIKRFSYPDELFVYILKNINKYPTLKRLLKELTKRYIIMKRASSSILSRIYRTNDEEIIANKLIDNIVDILNENKDNELADMLKRSNRSDQKILRNIIIDISRIGKNALIKLFLQTCVSSCTYCYINLSSCSRYTAPFIQGVTLNRRLLKLFATWFVKNKLYTVSKDEALKHFERVIGVFKINDETRYVVLKR